MHTNKALLNACPKQLPRQGTLNAKRVQISIEVKSFARVGKFPPSSFTYSTIMLNKL